MSISCHIQSHCVLRHSWLSVGHKHTAHLFLWISLQSLAWSCRRQIFCLKSCTYGIWGMWQDTNDLGTPDNSTNGNTVSVGPVESEVKQIFIFYHSQGLEYQCQELLGGISWKGVKMTTFACNKQDIYRKAWNLREELDFLNKFR